MITGGTAGAEQLRLVPESEGLWTVDKLQTSKPTQKALAIAVDEVCSQSLLVAADKYGKARLRAVSMNHACDYLKAVAHPWLRFDSREFGLALRVQLGLPVYPDGGKCRLCKEFADHFGRHALSCAASNDRAARHNTGRDLFAAFASQAAVGTTDVVKEHLHLIPGSQSRPGDVTIDRWHDGQLYAFDLTYWSPYTVANLTDASTTQGHAAGAAEAKKIKDAGQKCQAAGIGFTPLAGEIHGGWGDLAVQTYKKLAMAVAMRTGRSWQDELRYFHQRLSVALHRSNARMIQKRAPPLPSA